ncbi:MAG: GNAT family N-acetyltransferase [Candidatus Dormibacteraeota bacterium]|nr:GNAT family N-acetyltransferase [Candidatus Dormibacteraeota bacterium]
MTAGSREIVIGGAREVIWELLVAPGRRDWYYRLTAEGEFTAGAKIRWLDAAGTIVEESEILEIEPPRRMALRTRFLFAPPFAAAEPHLITWKVTSAGDGSHVQMSWDGEGPAIGLLESEAESQLQGLRLAADPVARAQLQRLETIGAIDIRDVAPEMVPEYQRFFDDYAFRDYPAWQSCYCMETHRTQSDEEWAARTAEDNRRDMTESVASGQVTALLAFEGDKPVGWCNYGETTRLAGVMHRFKLQPADQDGVGSVACFVVAAPYRGHGVASKLLDAAIDRLRARGLRAVEAYPTRPRDDTAQGNYRGPLSMYLRAGFEPRRETDRHVIVRKTL